MLAILIRRILPLLVLGGLSLSSCVVHERDYGRRDRGRGNDHGRGYGRDHHRDYGYRHDRY